MEKSTRGELFKRMTNDELQALAWQIIDFVSPVGLTGNDPISKAIKEQTRGLRREIFSRCKTDNNGGK